MIQDTQPLSTPPEAQSGRLMIHVMLQFLAAVRYRIRIVILALTATGLLGAAYFVTATRYYSATAGMLMIQSGVGNLETSMTDTISSQRNLMKTFETVLRSPTVVEGALEKLGPEDRVDLENVARKGWVSALRERISTKNIPSTNILEVSVKSKKPEVAVNLVNAVVDSYLEFLDETHKGTTGEIREIFSRQLADVGRELKQKEESLIHAQTECGVLPSGDGKEILDPATKRALYFADELSKIERKRIDLQPTLARVQTAVRNGEDLRRHWITVANVVGQEMMMRSFGLSPADIQTQASLEQTLLTDQAVLESMRGRVGMSHPSMIAQQEKVRLAREYLQRNQERAAESISRLQNEQLGPLLVEMVRQQLQEAVEQEQSLRVQFQAAQADASRRTGQIARLTMLQREVKRLYDLSDALVSQIASLDLRQDGHDVRAKVTAPPVANQRPVSPRLAFVALVAIASGLGIGFAAVYVLDVLDDRFRDIDDMQQQLGVPILSLIRRLNVPETCGLDAIQLHVAPASTESEAFRTLRTALALADRELNRIVVTSAEPGDGKTTIIANLATCYAQSNKKTLLIDADLRRPGLTNLMQMRQQEGLSTVLRSDAHVADLCVALIQPTGIERLDVLPCGPRPANPAELLAGPRFLELIDWASTVYDQILIDSPPTLATSDSAVIGRLVDGTILVVQPEKNHRRAVIRAVEGLLSLRIPLLGLVVNHAEGDDRGGYYGYGYGYGYGYEYSGGYGNDEDDYTDETEAVVDTRPPRDERLHHTDPDGGGRPDGIVPRRAA